MPMTAGDQEHSLPARPCTKIVRTITSVREDGCDEEVTHFDHASPTSRTSLLCRKESAFMTETSFTRAPLGSRVSPAAVVRHSKGVVHKEHSVQVSVEIQEALILEDLIYILMGIEGTYITHNLNDDENYHSLDAPHFVLSHTFDSSLRDFAERMLPMATYYHVISSFVETRGHLDCGLVNHALCAAIRYMLKDYHILLAQLEHAFNFSPHFTLRKLWYYIHPTLHTLSLIYHLVIELECLDHVSSSGSDSDIFSELELEEEQRQEALGLGGANLKALLSTMRSENNIAVTGGEVLAVIYERMQHMSGDPTAHTLYSMLLRAAAVPYFAMLKAWVTTGHLHDPYEEFFVKKNKSINQDTLASDDMYEHWDQKYVLRDGSTRSMASKTHVTGVPRPRPTGGRLPGGACIPPMLDQWKHKVLLAGKYINVVRECGVETSQRQSPSDDDLAIDDEKLYDFIENAYDIANRTLLDLLLNNQQLIPRLQTLKRYFLLSQSTYLRHFLDLSHSELRKPAQSASVVRLQSLLDLAVATDSVAPDDNAVAFREELKVKISGSGLYEWLLKVANVSGIDSTPGVESSTGEQRKVKGKERDKEDKKALSAIDGLTLDYTVDFPLSLIISRRAILRYQLLFRFLLHLKHLEQSLSSMWTEQNTTLWRQAVPNLPELEKWRLRVSLLRAQMLAFVQQVLAFATSEVIEPSWRILEMKLETVNTVDQLLMHHDDFLDTCLKGCMLTSSKLLEAHSRLMVTCSTFARYATAFSRDIVKALAAGTTLEGDQSMSERWVFLGKFETHFNHWFRLYLDHVQFDALSESVSLLPLVARLKNIQAEHP